MSFRVVLLLYSTGTNEASASHLRKFSACRAVTFTMSRATIMRQYG